jgi:hypothetical protein
MGLSELDGVLLRLGKKRRRPLKQFKSAPLLWYTSMLRITLTVCASILFTESELVLICGTAPRRPHFAPSHGVASKKMPGANRSPRRRASAVFSPRDRHLCTPIDLHFRKGTNAWIPPM